MSRILGGICALLTLTGCLIPSSPSLFDVQVVPVDENGDRYELCYISAYDVEHGRQLGGYGFEDEDRLEAQTHYIATFEYYEKETKAFYVRIRCEGAAEELTSQTLDFSSFTQTDFYLGTVILPRAE